MQDNQTQPPDDAAVIGQQYIQPGQPVIGSDGRKLGKVSDKREAGYLVVDRGPLADEKMIAVPLAAIAGADKDGVYLLYKQEELLGRTVGTPLNAQATTSGDLLAREIRPPQPEMERATQKIDEKDIGHGASQQPR